MKPMIKPALFSILAIAAGLSSVGTPIARADSDAAYFQQFAYSESTDADGNVTTRFLMSTAPDGVPGFDVGPATQGEIEAHASLFLINDGTFVLKYMEMTSTGAPITFPMDIVFNGNWSVPDQQLLVGDIATGTRAVYETRNAVQLTFLKDLNTPGLKGKTAILDFGFSNEKPTDP